MTKQRDTTRTIAVGLAIVAASAGILGMFASFFFLAASAHADLIAGAAGFVGSTVLLAASVVATALLAQR